jgi:transcriptional regulator of acetoin/glycerol metabolism
LIDETQTEADDDARSARAGTAPMLFVALECGRPEARSARYVLRGIDSVAIGRGKKRRRCARDGEVMRIEVPDRRMSSAHAVVERVLGRWVIVDKGSKNGVRVNGEKIERSTLEDGDVIETGWTLWRYRSALPITGDLDVADASPPAPGLGTVVPSLEESWEQLARVAASKISIVLGGESGTGKEVAARAIHQLSGRPGDFVAVNCGALPEKLVESELFGHVKGAFSGAASDRRGYVRAADGGTLLLDEIGDLPAPAQAALLRILEEREVVPIGGERPIPLDLRIVAASHRDLGKMVERGEFRADLFARLSGISVELPPLRDRREDLGSLVADLLPRRASLSKSAGVALLRYDWPLNIRELKKCLETAAVLAAGDEIEVEHLPAAVQGGPRLPTSDPAELDLSDEDAGRRQVLDALLAEHGGNISAVAREMGKTRLQIHRWIKRYRIDLESHRGG